MSIFHEPIKRTFHRKAKNGRVICEGKEYLVIDDNSEPFSGAVTLRLNVRSPSAHVKGDPFKVLRLQEIEAATD